MVPSQSGRRGFTLFEVLVSMLILSVAILSVALLLPAGLRSQEAARYKAIAAVTALNLVSMYEHARPAFTQVRGEGLHMSHNVWATHEPGMYDIERFLSSSYHARNALVPVPLDIARRLDSDQDEIQSILDEGGYIYFPSPLPSRLGEFEGTLRDAQIVINVAQDAVPYAYEGFDESQRLVVGFVGYAQQNALPWHPMSMGPGREYYPTAPLHRVYGPDIQPQDMGMSSNAFSQLDASEKAIALSNLSNCTALDAIDLVRMRGNLDHASWAYWRDHEAAVDADTFAKYVDVVQAFADWEPPEEPAPGLDPTRPRGAQWNQRKSAGSDDLAELAPRVEAYFLACEALVEAVVPGFTRADLVARPVTESVTGVLGPDASPDPWQVAAMRYYAHAAMWMTRFVDATWADPTYADSGAAPKVGLEETAELKVEDCVAIHEHSLRWVMHYRAHRPYDWGVPRPYNSAVMLDNALLQVDLFNAGGVWDPADGSYLLNHGASRLAHDPPGYRVIAPRGCSAKSGGNPYIAAFNAIAAARDVPTNLYGNWWTHDNNYQVYAERMAAGWGRSEHFNLLQRFQPAERCRQLVIWAVDWQRYEDAERAAAAPSDASWYPYESEGTVSTKASSTGSRPSRSGDVRKRGRTETGFMGSLSMMLNWKDEPSGYTSENLVDVGEGVTVQELHRGTQARVLANDGPTTMAPWMGRHGIDANGNNLFDRGTVPQSLRMRATEIARFNIYDGRVWAAVRN